MVDDWEKKYWAQKQQQLQKQSADLPHFEPAHITQDKMRALNGASAPQHNRLNGGWKDIDPLTAMYSNQDGLSSRGMGPPPTQTVTVREGALYWRPVAAENYGSTMPMVRSCGPFVGASSKTFELRSEVHCYCIDNMKVVDLSKVDQGQMLSLVEVRAPFIGTVLVRKEDVLSPGNNGRAQVLKG